METKEIKIKELSKHETKRNVTIRYLLVVLVFLVYFFFISRKYGIQQGFLVTALTRSFFVLCTPVADAGFLIDFPLRFLTKIRMLSSEIFVWIVAISLNVYMYFFKPEIYANTKLLSLLKHILDSLFPFGIIILISMIGTFVSIRFGDELMDNIQHKERVFYKKNKKKYKLIIMIFIFAITFVIYDFILKKLGFTIPTI